MNPLGALLVRLGLDPSGFDKGLDVANAKLTQFKNNTIKNAAEAKEAINGIAEGALGFQAIMAGLLGAAVFEGLKKMVEGWDKAEASIIRLNAALQATGRYSIAASLDIQKNAAAISKQTEYSKSAIIEATSSVAIFAKKLNAGELKDSQKAIVGIAATMGIDLNSAALKVGKTLGTNTNVLKRMGIEINATADQHTKLAEILKKTNTMYEVAQAQGTSTAAREGQLQRAIQGLSNAFGQAIEAGLDLNKTLHDMADRTGEATEAVKAHQVQIAFWVRLFKVVAFAALDAGQMVWNGMEAIGQSFSGAMLAIMQGVTRGVNTMTLGVTEGINKVIRASNMIPGVNNKEVQPWALPEHYTAGRERLAIMADNTRNSFQGAAKRIYNGFASIGGPYDFDIPGADKGNSAHPDTAGADPKKAKAKKAKAGKVDPDISAAKSAVDAAMTPMEKYTKAVQDADRWLKKHLITYAQWKEITDKADLETNKQVKLNPGVDELTKEQRARVDMTKLGSASGDVKTALDKMIKKPFEEWTKTFKDDWQQELKDIASGQSITDSVATATDKYNQTLAELKRQLDKNNISQATYDEALKKAKETASGLGKTISEEYTARLKELDQQYKAGIITVEQYTTEAQKAWNEYKTNFSANAQAISGELSSISDGIVSTFITNIQGGTASWGDFFKTTLAGLAKLAIQLTIIRPLMDAVNIGINGKNSAGQQVTQGASGAFSFLGKLLGGSGGASAASSIGASVGSSALKMGGVDFGSVISTSLAGFATGGTFNVGKPMLVGEQGPELGMPASAGKIISNSQIKAAIGSGGGDGVALTQTFQIQANDAVGFRELLKREKVTIQRMALDGVQQAQNKRGRLGPMDNAKGGR